MGAKREIHKAENETIKMISNRERHVLNRSVKATPANEPDEERPGG